MSTLFLKDFFKFAIKILKFNPKGIAKEIA